MKHKYLLLAISKMTAAYWAKRWGLKSTEWRFAKSELSISRTDAKAWVVVPLPGHELNQKSAEITTAVNKSPLRCVPFAEMQLAVMGARKT